MTEKELQSMIAKYLSRYFVVESEVWSECHTRRIDLMITHKSDCLCAYPIGVEIKKFDDKRGKDVGDWLKQAHDYSGLLWKGYGPAIIIVAPQISGLVFSEGKLTDHGHMDDGDPTAHHNVSTFLGQFKIGEFQRYNWFNYAILKNIRLARIVYKGSILWNENGDVFNTDAINRVCKR